MRITKFVSLAGFCAGAVLWLATASLAIAQCAQYEQHGLAPGMTAKQVATLMGGKGQLSERDRHSISRYVTATATIEVEYDGVIARRRDTRVTRIETQIAERVVNYEELVRSLVERIGQPSDGFSENAGRPGLLPVQWIDEVCNIEVKASRHVPEWWEPGQGPTVRVEFRSRPRVPGGLAPRAAPRRTAEQVLGPRTVVPLQPDTAADDSVTGTAEADNGAADTRAADARAADIPAAKTPASNARIAEGRSTTAPAEPMVTNQSSPPVAAAALPVTNPAPLTVSAALQEDPDFQAPVARHKPLPKFPMVARDQRGSVVLNVLVDEQGRVDEVTVRTSAGSKLLQDTAMRAVKRWRYDPATRGGVPVSVWTTVSFGFDPSSR